MTRIAIIDDWGGMVGALPIWKRLDGRATIDRFSDTLPSEDALAARLEPYEIIVPTRERTFFRAGLIARLPRLRLIAIGGRWTGQVDLAAAAARGIVVTDTEGSGVNAFEHAVSLGYSYLETDVHATADGVLVAFHDRTLDRVTDRAGRISQLPHREVSAARIGGTDPIPLLEDLLGAWPEKRFNIDVKDEPAVRPLVEVLGRTAAWDRVCVTSFSAWRLGAVRRALPRPV